MPIQIALLALIAAACTYIYFIGQQTGRRAAPLICISAGASLGAAMASYWLVCIALDMMCLFGFVVVAGKCAGKWPIYCAGLQLAKLTTHIAAWIISDVSEFVYLALLELWVLLMLAFAVYGIWADRRLAR